MRRAVDGLKRTARRFRPLSRAALAFALCSQPSLLKALIHIPLNTIQILVDGVDLGLGGGLFVRNSLQIRRMN
jgi:hypothetical protein